MTMREKQILARAMEIQKEYWGVTTHFFRDDKAIIILKSSKIQSNVRRFLPNLSFIIPEKCMVIPNFLFGY